MSIAPVQIPQISRLPETQPAEKKPASEHFVDALENARRTEDDATKQAEGFAKGDPSIGIHEVVIAAEKANIAVRNATTLKNKALEAYRELMNTQV
jgi:flagellar hook-basal body complex protein FliE